VYLFCLNLLYLSVSYGPPISLDWEYADCDSLLLDDYEGARPPRRKLRMLMMNYYNRRNLLTYCYGVTEDQLKQAEKQANRDKRHRAMTRAFLPAQLVEEAMQSAARKTKRLYKSKPTTA
jgi:hypothetical protein